VKWRSSAYRLQEDYFTKLAITLTSWKLGDVDAEIKERRIDSTHSLICLRIWKVDGDNRTKIADLEIGKVIRGPGISMAYFLTEYEFEARIREVLEKVKA